MKKTIIIFVALTAAIILFWVFNPARTPEIETVQPVRKAAVQAVYATGTVEASAMIPIASKIAARLMSLEVDEGSRVGKGALLAQLEDADLQQTLVEAQARLELAQRDLARAEKLAKSGAIARQALDDTRAAYATAEAAAERSKAELSYLRLVAPEDGTIIRRDGEIGELMTAGEPVFWMNGGDAIRIETEVDEEDISLVRPGQRVVISADAFPGQIYEGTVASITPKGDPVARSYRVRVTLAGGTPLMIGMTAETNIITQEKDDALMVPVTAVKGSDLFILKDGRPALTRIEKGITGKDMVEIVGGADEADQIVLRYDDAAGDNDMREKASCNMSNGC